MISTFDKHLKNDDLIKLYQREYGNNSVPSNPVLADYASYHRYEWDTLRLVWSKKLH